MRSSSSCCDGAADRVDSLPARSPAHLAGAFARHAARRLLHGAQPQLQNNRGQTAASLAARYGRPAGLGVLFRADASLVEARDGCGRTPIHWAVVSAHTPTLKYVRRVRAP
jgi:hypothetical protein